MRTRLNGHRSEHEPQRTVDGLLLYLGLFAAIPLAMSYPVAVATGVVATGLLLRGGRSAVRDMASRPSDGERRSRSNVLGGNHDVSPRSD